MEAGIVMPAAAGAAAGLMLDLAAEKTAAGILAPEKPGRSGVQRGISVLCGMILSVCSFNVYGNSGQAWLTFFTGSLLFLIARVDADTMEIPDWLTIMTAAGALSSVWVFPDISLAERTAGLLCLSLPMSLICFLVPDAFGGGDIKLAAVMGAYLGWKACLAGTFAAVVAGGMQAVFLLASGRAKPGTGAHMPFGPALCAGMFLASLAGERMFEWYAGFFIW